MFLIVPKLRQQKPAPQVTDPGQELAHTTDSTPKHLRGPARVQSACDECRARKIKCNGQNPCGRCRARNIVCVFNFAEAKKRLKGPLTAAQASTLEAQQTRLVDAIKSMSAKIKDLEASLSTKRDNGTDDDDARGPETQQLPVTQDENFDLNAVLDKYAPPWSDNNLLPSARESGQIVFSNKRRRTDQSTVSHRQSMISHLPNSTGLPLVNNYTSDLGPTFSDRSSGLSANELGTTLGTSVPYDQMIVSQSNDSLVPFQLSAGFTRETSDSLQITVEDTNDFPELMMDSIEPGAGTMLPPSIEELYLQCQNMDALMESIDWDTSRALSARLLR
ncbi:hypothetical protein AUEXF2481DRAFT_410723 [Aureobasidium subglaciale EXF-2481]|uniref:Zn(2)-C6 fungal-type domain-containing protein n=1 Tax=Aureobasidium subglaciale (strain EXF-2481) TaxID=1043005 RepID=A0A074Y492_AURSE|nr:uncharacterized protein AUEXF2481DRAFT_410723 [Aureobasidium subglaciale EXF-2481]KAI5210854.1 hypothetical protein E4T38_01850 [Aureobasidium subglaciale]KAI5229329.1 hypothetical protein E4T40_01629 [Aureobasidium subglaciale]KAI5232983.1 hypothetical protein E4T41_01848 [Aureobasidium subglaciale]KAI5266371.1 hypothetical protein E4T46_01626 [Aureobasidium subglaciale]KEQ92598.1 hypothetical protein AUEXF2481DRAFT_410723 [Aureobasidium subglaciale EXF-2481]